MVFYVWREVYAYLWVVARKLRILIQGDYCGSGLGVDGGAVGGHG